MTRKTNAVLPVIILFAVSLFLLVPLAWSGSEDSNGLDTFAQRSAEIKQSCTAASFASYCDDQKALFGKSFRYVAYVECSVRGGRQMTFPCVAAQVRFTPTWIFANGDRLTGFQPLKVLSEKTGCKLP